jgi:hypothetical protein
MSVRKTLFVAGLLLTAFLISCNSDSGGKLPADLVTNPNSAEGRNNGGLPVIQFDKDVHDFGKLIAGEKASFGFRFTNAGSADLLISQVNTTCGCTIPKFPKTPVKPGEKKEITVTFDSEGKKGMQQKSITVVTNCQPPQTVIWIKAMVIAN